MPNSFWKLLIFYTSKLVYLIMFWYIQTFWYICFQFLCLAKTWSDKMRWCPLPSFPTKRQVALNASFLTHTSTSAVSSTPISPSTSASVDTLHAKRKTLYSFLTFFNYQELFSLATFFKLSKNFDNPENLLTIQKDFHFIQWLLRLSHNFRIFKLHRKFLFQTQTVQFVLKLKLCLWLIQQMLTMQFSTLNTLRSS